MSNKKKVVILLATYRPNMFFFEKLFLTSLNQQDYSNLELYVRDDSADKEWSIKIEKMVLTTITKIPSYFEKNEINRGSNKTFEILTKDCLGITLLIVTKMIFGSLIKFQCSLMKLKRKMLRCVIRICH